MKTKPWGERGLEIDVNLLDHWVDRLNDLPEWDVISTCSGHLPDDYDEDTKGFAGPQFPNFDIKNNEPNFAIASLDLKRWLEKRMPKTEVLVRWESEDGAIAFNCKDFDKAKDYDFAILAVNSPFKVGVEIDALITDWWNTVLYHMEGYFDERRD